MKKKVISVLMALTCAFSSFGVFTKNYVHAVHANDAICGVDVDESWVPVNLDNVDIKMVSFWQTDKFDDGITLDSVYVGDDHWSYVQLLQWYRGEGKKQRLSKRYPKGDVDFNGKIDITDVTLIAAYAKGKRMFTRIPKTKAWMADINNDGRVNITDVTRVAARAKGHTVW